MYCPKCGQRTININDKEICTACGIVFDDSLPKDQILEQIKSSISSQKGSSVQEEYVSPSAKYLKEMLLEAEKQEKNTTTSVSEQPQAINVSAPPSQKEEKTIAEIASSPRSESTLTATQVSGAMGPSQTGKTNIAIEKIPVPSDLNQEEEHTIAELSKPQITNFVRPDSRAQRVQISEEGVVPQVVQEEAVAQNGLSHLPTLEAEDSNKAPIESDYKGIEPVTAVAGAGTIRQKEPHHLINDIRPIFIKILFYLLFFTFLAGSGYFIYKNHGKLLEMFNSVSVYVGENIFKQ